MRSLRYPVHETRWRATPERLAEACGIAPGLVLLRSHGEGSPWARYSLVTSRPFLTLITRGAHCEFIQGRTRHREFGNPWSILNAWLSRYELLDEIDLPFPLGGCFGIWGYGLKHFVEPCLSRRVPDDLNLPDGHFGFYSSLVVFDHALHKTWIVATGLGPRGDRSPDRAARQLQFWRERLERATEASPRSERLEPGPAVHPRRDFQRIEANLNPHDYRERVRRAQTFIRQGDIYQVNLAQRLTWHRSLDPWGLYRQLSSASPAPYSAFLHCGRFQLASSSPELFLRMSGRHVLTRPIKGTRPCSPDAVRDARYRDQLTTSSKERAELVMITDLLRNDLGRICDYGSVQVPELITLARFAQVYHQMSTVEGTLRKEVSHDRALAGCFPGGSITGAPKIRAMEVIEELEPVARGPYTGALGYLGFNRESQLSVVIRTAVTQRRRTDFHVGAGIVADSVPEQEYQETMVKAAGFLRAISELPNEQLNTPTPWTSELPCSFA